MASAVAIEGIALEQKRAEPYATSIVLSAAAIVRRRDGKVLVTLEGDRPYHDMWVIPMGYVQANENVVDAVSREVKEETGMEIAVEGLVGVYDDRIDIETARLHHVIVCYRTKAVTDQPMVTREAREWIWKDRKGIERLTAPGVVKEMLSDYFRSSGSRWFSLSF
jgi:ADP-ribose pyrophosphatase YjhB (NUDIX family)